METSNERIDCIDIAKGIGILLVIGHHVTQSGSLINSYISNFHMPLFFLLSGLLFNPYRHPHFKEYCKRKCRVLLKPLICFTLLNLALSYAAGVEHYTLHKMLTPAFPTAMWFIFILLLTELFFFFIAKQRTVTIICIIVACCGIATFFEDNGINLPLSLCSICWAICFYGIGYLLKNTVFVWFTSKERIANIIMMLGLCLPLIDFLIFDNAIDINGNHLPHPEVLFIGVAVATSLCIIRFAALLPPKKYSAYKILLFYGPNSMTILCLHMLFINFSSNYFSFTPHAIYKIVVEIPFVVGMSGIAAYIIARWGKFMLK